MQAHCKTNKAVIHMPVRKRKINAQKPFLKKLRDAKFTENIFI